MSEHMRMHHTENKCEVILKIPGKKKELSYIPIECVGQLKSFLSTQTEKEDSVDWTIVAKESIDKHKKAGMVLRGARFRENISQKKLAELSGISQENISRIENGKRMVGEKVAKKLAKPLKIDYLLLLGDI